MSKLKRVRLKLPSGESLTVYVRPSYILLSRVAPGQRNFVHEIYIPRTRILPLLRWIAAALRAVPPEDDFYPPLATREHYQKIDALEENQKAQKKQIAEQRHQQAKRKRYLAAKRRAKKRRRAP